jgi:hypothetical protein
MLRISMRDFARRPQLMVMSPVTGETSSALASEPLPDLRRIWYPSRDRALHTAAREVKGKYFFALDVKYTSLKYIIHVIS